MTVPEVEEIYAEFKVAHAQVRAARLLLKERFHAQAIASTYYACFHATRAALWTHGKTTKTHSGLAHLFYQELVATGKVDKRFAQILGETKEQRERADYDTTHFQATGEDVEKLISQAEEFIAQMESVASEEK